MRAVSRGFAKDGGSAGAVDAGRIAGGALSRGFELAGRARVRHEPGFHLRPRANCSGTHSVGVETFSRGSGCPRLAREMPERDLFYGCGTGGRGEQSWNSALGPE